MCKTFKVAKVIDEYTVVINAGSTNGIKKNQRFLIYSLNGEEVLDPDTNEVIGFLERVKGTGIVTSLMDKMCIVTSDMYSKYTQFEILTTVPTPFSSEVRRPKITDRKHLGFDDSKICDLVRLI